MEDNRVPGIDDQEKEPEDQLPDPDSCDPYDYQLALDKLIENFEQKHIADKEGFAGLINEMKLDKLKSIYQLCLNESKMYIISRLWAKFIWARIDQFFEEDFDVDEFIELKRNCSLIVDECFGCDPDLARELGLATVRYNHPLTKLVVEYLHNQLSIASKHKQSTRETRWIKHVTEMFPYLDMTRFRRLYKRYLVHRLIKFKILAIEAERLMLSGFDNTEEVLQDIEATEIKRKADLQWREYLALNQIDLGMELQVKLINCNWYKTTELDMECPYEFQRVMQIYSNFVSERCKNNEINQNGRLSLTKYSTCEMIGNFKSGSKPLLVTVEQAAVLLLFNDYEELSFEDIAIKTGLDVKRAKQILFPIVRSGILVPDQHGLSYSEVEIVRYGKEFSSLQPKFKFTDVKKKRQSKLTEQNKGVIQAAIVRFTQYHRQQALLEHKVIEYAIIQCETRFPVTIIEVNRAISDLIKKGYILRSGVDKNKIEHIS